MKLIFENWRRYINEEESNSEKIKDKIKTKLDDEGGAAGLEPLVKAAKEVDPDVDEEDVKKMFKETLQEIINEITRACYK